MTSARFARCALVTAAIVALSACSASLPGPARAPETVPSSLDTGTPARSNLALSREARLPGA
jgi:hypothetical protein